MKKLKLFYSLALFAGFIVSANGADSAVKAYWNFGSASSLSDAPQITAVAPPVSVGALGAVRSGNATVISSSSVSGSYSGASGGGNAGIGFGPANPSFSLTAAPYFSWTVTPSTPGTGLTITPASVSFGSRSTGTGARKWDLYAVSENGAVETHLGGGNINPNSSWTLHSINVAAGTLSDAELSAGAPVEFRLYGWDFTAANGGTVTWRIDDLTLEFACGSCHAPRLRQSFHRRRCHER